MYGLQVWPSFRLYPRTRSKPINLRQVLIAWSMVLALMSSCGGKSTSSDTAANPILEDIRASMVRTIGVQDDSLEAAISGNILTVLRVNSELNQFSHAARNGGASAIGSVVSKAVADKPDTSYPYHSRAVCEPRERRFTQGDHRHRCNFAEIQWQFSNAHDLTWCPACEPIHTPLTLPRSHPGTVGGAQPIGHVRPGIPALIRRWPTAQLTQSWRFKLQPGHRVQARL